MVTAVDDCNDDDVAVVAVVDANHDTFQTIHGLATLTMMAIPIIHHSCENIFSLIAKFPFKVQLKKWKIQKKKLKKEPFFKEEKKPEFSETEAKIESIA